MTKAKVLASAKELGIEITDEISSIWRHIHAYAPRGSRFVGHDTHSLSLWDASRGYPVDWDDILKDLKLESCSPATCDAECYWVVG